MPNTVAHFCPTLEKGVHGTHDSVLDAETQLVAKVWPPDQHGGHRGAPHDVQLHPGLVLQALIK